MGGKGAIRALVGGIANAANAAKNAQALAVVQQKTERHNDTVEEQIGKGVVANVVGKVLVIVTRLKNLLEKIGLGKCECKCNKVMNDGVYHLGSGLYLRPMVRVFIFWPPRIYCIRTTSMIIPEAVSQKWLFKSYEAILNN